jgi:hypothetical protein
LITSNELIEFAEKLRKPGDGHIYQFQGIGSEFFRILKETIKRF